jgi:hypothetical protein
MPGQFAQSRRLAAGSLAFRSKRLALLAMQPLGICLIRAHLGNGSLVGRRLAGRRTRRLRETNARSEHNDKRGQRRGLQRSHRNFSLRLPLRIGEGRRDRFRSRRSTTRVPRDFGLFGRHVQAYFPALPALGRVRALDQLLVASRISNAVFKLTPTGTCRLPQQSRHSAFRARNSQSGRSGCLHPEYRA